MTGRSDILAIPDDIWHSTIRFFNAIDFVSIQQTCSYFHKLGNHKQHSSMSKYWENQCQYIWSKIEANNFKTHDWKQFFISLLKCMQTKPNHGRWHIPYTFNTRSYQLNEVDKCLQVGEYKNV